MKLGVVITMYDEFELVFNTIKNIKENFKESYIVVVQSECGETNDDLESIQILADEFIILPDLSKNLSRFELPARAICRNLSAGFSALYYSCIEFDIIVALTGDTLITDSNSFLRRFADMIRNKWVGMVSQALGQDFHAPHIDLLAGHGGGRYQDANSTDFACCFFILDGRVCISSKAFADIEVTNKWTSEQCLGDEIVRVMSGNTMDFRKKVGILNHEQPYVAYAYNDGLTYHAKTGSPSR